MLKNNKGITLIALVITIIVLLILAGVSIAMLTGENGILKQATRSVDATELAEARERAGLDVNGLIAEYYEEVYVKSNTTHANVLAYIDAKLTDVDNEYYSYESNTITLKPKAEDGSTVTGEIDTNGGIEWSDETTEPSA